MYCYRLAPVPQPQVVRHLWVSLEEADEISCRYMHRLIRRKMLSFNTGSNFHPILQLEKEEVEWLGLHAFVQVLKRKQSQYKKLLSILRSRLSNHKITGSLSSELSYAVDMSHSSLMWKIKF